MDEADKNRRLEEVCSVICVVSGRCCGQRRYEENAIKATKLGNPDSYYADDY